MISRRSVLVGSAALGACGPKLAKRFNGYCFIANEGSRNLAVVNLTHFRVDRHIALDSAPGVVVPHPNRKAVLALLPEQGTVVEASAATLTVLGKIRLAAQADGMRLASSRVWLLATHPPAIVSVSIAADLATEKHRQTIALPHSATDFDVSPDGTRAIASDAGQNRCTLIDLRRGEVSAKILLPSEPAIVRFRPDGKQVLIGSTSGRTITLADAATGRVIVVLPMPFSPKNFCFSADNGGQLFTTGPGMDAVGIVYPYQGELAETMLAGHEPAAMTVNDSLLFVTNPTGGDVTVIGIAERQVVARVESGSGPCAVALADDYALVLNRTSGDLAVVRLSKLTDLRYKRAPLFTVVPVGETPVSAAVCRL